MQQISGPVGRDAGSSPSPGSVTRPSVAAHRSSRSISPCTRSPRPATRSASSSSRSPSIVSAATSALGSIPWSPACQARRASGTVVLGVIAPPPPSATARHGNSDGGRSASDPVGETSGTIHGRPRPADAGERRPRRGRTRALPARHAAPLHQRSVHGRNSRGPLADRPSARRATAVRCRRRMPRLPAIAQRAPIRSARRSSSAMADRLAAQGRRRACRPTAPRRATPRRREPDGRPAQASAAGCGSLPTTLGLVRRP